LKNLYFFPETENVSNELKELLLLNFMGYT